MIHYIFLFELYICATGALHSFVTILTSFTCGFIVCATMALELPATSLPSVACSSLLCNALDLGTVAGFLASLAFRSRAPALGSPPVTCACSRAPVPGSPSALHFPYSHYFGLRFGHLWRSLLGHFPYLFLSLFSLFYSIIFSCFLRSPHVITFALPSIVNFINWRALLSPLVLAKTSFWSRRRVFLARNV